MKSPGGEMFLANFFQPIIIKSKGKGPNRQLTFEGEEVLKGSAIGYKDYV